MYHLKLQLSHGADDFPSVELVYEHLRHSFVHELVYAFVQLLALHRVVVLDVFEHFRGEGRKSFEMQFLAVGKRVADFEDAVVGQSDDIAGVCLLNGTLALCHELCRGGEAYGLSLPYVQIRLVALELSAAHLAECDTRTVVGVDICRYLEYETCELRFFRFHRAFFGKCRAGARGYFHEAVEQFLDTEIVEGRTEEHRRHACFAVFVHVEFRIDTLHEFQVFAQLFSVVADTPVEFLAVYVHLHFFCHSLLVGSEQVEFVLVDVVNALELGALVDGP